MFACVGRHPNSAAGFDDDAAAGAAGARRRRRASRRSARPGSTSTAMGPRATTSSARSARRSAIARDARQAAGDPHARGRGPRATTPSPRRSTVLADEAEGVEVILHCFSAPPERVAEAVGERLVLLVRRERHLSEGGRAARGGAAGPGRADPGRDRLAVPGAAVAPRQAERAGASWSRRRARSRRRAGWSYDDVRGAGGGERRAGVQVVRLGQNFLADTNLLDAIVREARARTPRTWCSRSAAGRGR